MATANQLKTLVKSHFEDNSEKFNTVALQIAAHEAKLGHTNLANDIRKIIDAVIVFPVPGFPEKRIFRLFSRLCLNNLSL